jgi:hypothetical protein
MLIGGLTWDMTHVSVAEPPNVAENVSPGWGCAVVLVAIWRVAVPVGRPLTRTKPFGCPIWSGRSMVFVGKVMLISSATHDRESVPFVVIVRVLDPKGTDESLYAGLGINFLESVVAPNYRSRFMVDSFNCM